MEVSKKLVKIDLLHPNKGQVEGLPKNPRFIKDKRFNALVKSIKDNPEMLELREVIAYDNDGELVVVCGNMRLKAAKECGIDELPTKILPKDTPAENLRAYAIKDNVAFGEDDWGILTEEWDAMELIDWGLEMSGYEDEEKEEEVAKDEEVELLINEAMRKYCGEFAEQCEWLLQIGSIGSGITEGLARIKFLRAKYYGEDYPRYLSLAFCPRQFLTAGKNQSYFDRLKETHESGKSGIAGFRTLTSDGNLISLFKSNYPIASARMPLDFPVSLVQAVLNKYKPAKVLDPCHGWGGRLTGCMICDIEEYFGCDPSPVAHEGVERLYNAFRQYSNTKATLHELPFEDCELPPDYFDLALTSPPYFDVEKYDGEKTSTTLYRDFDSWVSGFYTPLITKTYKALKAGGVFILQVGDQKYPLSATSEKIAAAAGFECSVIPAKNYFSNLHDTSELKCEKLMELRKPIQNER